MDKKEYEEIERNANILQTNASNKCNAEIQKAQNYYNGYQQGIEECPIGCEECDGDCFYYAED